MDSLLNILDGQFAAIDAGSRRLLDVLAEEDLFRQPRPLERTYAMFSCGEYILRSAAAVEQTFGGITTKLWDDPFEWTLPEKLSSIAAMVEYLNDVEETRQRGFAFFTSDTDLLKQMPAPEKVKPIAQILLETVSRSRHFQGRAFAVFQMISDTKLPAM